MHLIVAEKNISANRIAQILAGNEKVKDFKEGGISNYRFDNTVVVGLRGHVVEVDFVEGYSNWRSAERTPRSLIDAQTIKIPTEKKIVALLQKLAKKSDIVTIATDFDTEGELIGKEATNWSGRSTPPSKSTGHGSAPLLPKRSGRHFPIQPISILHSQPQEKPPGHRSHVGGIPHPFFKPSSTQGGNNILSVGRVQSPTLTMIVDREKEIDAFIPEKYWQLHLDTERTESLSRPGIPRLASLTGFGRIRKGSYT